MKIAFALVLFAAVYGLSLLHLSLSGAGDLEEILPVLVIFGGIVGGASWLATFRMTAPSIALRQSGQQLGAVLGFSLLLIVWLCWGVGEVHGLLPATMKENPALMQCVTLVEKLVLFVLVPGWMLHRSFGCGWGDFGLSRDCLRALRGRAGIVALVLSLLVMAINLIIGSAAAPLRDGSIATGVLVIALPLCFVWNVLDAGIVEEFFFRAVLQTRLAAVCKSQSIGAVLMVILFGLFHAPGLVLRGAGAIEGLGTAPTMLDAAAYCVAIMGVAGLPFAILWARSRNLWIVILVHAANDTIAQLPSFIHMWGLD
jgi:membrane protease YdiL (CAAX protease family)